MLDKLLIISFFFCSFSAFTADVRDDTVYYNQYYDEIASPIRFGYYALQNSGPVNDNKVVFYTMNHTLFSVHSRIKGKSDGFCIWYHENGRISREGVLKNGRPIGEQQYYDISGVQERTDVYNKRHKMVAQYYKTESGKTVYTQADRLSSFGKYRSEGKSLREMNDFIARELVRPTVSEEAVQTVVIVTFLINPQGDLEEVIIENSSYDIVSVEVLNLMEKMPKWRPAKHNGTAVYSQMSIALSF